MQLQEAIQRLSSLTRIVAKAEIHDRSDFRAWVKRDGESILAERLAYEREDGMPAISALIQPFFHPDLPFVGWDYSQVAHNTLHGFHEGWTLPLRQCRSLVMDREGRLLAKPFAKFFHQSEHPETRQLPDEPYLAMEKHHGHLGILFRHEKRLHVTTRDTFTHRSAGLARAMIAKNPMRDLWNRHLPENLTVLVEIIHPNTSVIRRYDASELILIGAFDNDALREYNYAELLALGEHLNLRVAATVEFPSLAELSYHVTENVENREGFVVWYERTGLRVKFKYQTYIGKMVAAKLSYSYIIRRLLDGSWAEKMDMLAEEILPAARDMLAKIEEGRKAGAESLFLLESDERRTSEYRKVCREFVSRTEAA